MLDSSKKRKTLSNGDLIHANWKMLYNSTFFNIDLPGFFNQNYLNYSNNFIRLNFYESSFHFFIKRLSMFNNLFFNNIYFIPSQKTNKPLDKLPNFYSDLSLLYKSSLLQKVSNKLFTRIIPLTEDLLQNNTLRSLKGKGDLIILQKTSFVLNKKRIEIVYNVTKYNPYIGSYIKFFNKSASKYSEEYFPKKLKNLKQFQKNIRF